MAVRSSGAWKHTLINVNGYEPVHIVTIGQPTGIVSRLTAATLLETAMTTRVYLKLARVFNEPPQETDLPAERVFVNSSEVPEVWVETESQSVPDTGRAVAFALGSSIDIGFRRITGTVERRVRK